jgi:hypothetical protein
VAAQEESREIPAESAPNVFPNAAMRKRDSEAQALDGLTVARSWIDPNTGKARTFYGTVRFMGALRRPRYFDVTFEDGEVLQWTTALVKKYKHKAAGVDSAVVAASTVVAPSPALPQAWDLASGEGVELAFTHLMPGKWARNHCTRLANEYARYKTAPGSIPCIPTDPGEVQPLLAALDFSSVHLVLDPFSGLSGIAKAFHASGVSVSTNDLNAEHTADMHEDALQPAFYRHLTRKGGVDAVVMSPWFSFLDIAAPLACLFAASVVCVHVPGHYLTDATDARFAWLCNMKRAGCLHFVLGLPRGPMGRRCIWMCVFASPDMKRRMVRPEFDAQPYLIL